MAGSVERLSPEQLGTLLARATLRREEDTRIAGMIRIIEADGSILVQEQTPEGEILVRRVGSAVEAQALVEKRLEAYERMWDGCGCKIDYHQ